MGAFIVIAGGGTGGHVFPGLAIAQELKRRDSSRDILFLGSERGLETRLVPAAGFPLRTLRLGGIAGMSLGARLLASARALGAVARCLSLFLRTRPVLAVGVGGFASGPAVLAALLLRVPTLIQEQNAAAGLTNRWLGRWVDEIALSFPGSERDFGGRGTVTGNPVREAFFRISPYAGLRGPLKVLIFGGSRGARTLNRAAAAALPRLDDLAGRVEMTVQTGEADFAATAQACMRSRVKATALPFIDDMPHRLEESDLVVCRAGAGTVFELAAAGRASVLVPYPLSAGGHQDKNADWMARAGASVVIPDARFTGEELDRVVREAIASPGSLAKRAQAALTLARPSAASDIVSRAEALMGAGAR